jgi:hypothetical protein
MDTPYEEVKAYEFFRIINCGQMSLQRYVLQQMFSNYSACHMVLAPPKKGEKFIVNCFVKSCIPLVPDVRVLV